MPKRSRSGFVRRPAAKRRRRNVYRARRRRPPLGKPSRGLRTAVYLFKRRFVETFDLDNPPATWSNEGTAITCHTGYRLADLSDFSDFTNMFAQYKLNAVKIQMYFSSNVVTQVETATGTPAPPTGQILVYMCPNKTGQQFTLTEQYFLNNQATRTRTAIRGSGRPVNMYQRLMQLGERFAGAANTDYAVMRPRWIATQEANTLHTGQDLRLQYVNDQSLNNTSVKIIYTYYIACRQAQ